MDQKCYVVGKVDDLLGDFSFGIKLSFYLKKVKHLLYAQILVFNYFLLHFFALLGSRSWCWWDCINIILSPVQVVHIKTNSQTAQWFDNTCGLTLHQSIGFHVYQVGETC